METRGANVTPVYPGQDRRQGSRAGQYLIQPPIGKEGLLNDLLGADFTIISFDRPPQEAMSPQELLTWEKCGAVFLRIRPDGVTNAAYQAFEDWLGDCRRRLLVIRPDRFVKEDRLLST